MAKDKQPKVKDAESVLSSPAPSPKGPDATGSTGPSSSPKDVAFTRREPLEGGAKAKRLSIALTDEGTIDWDSMRGVTQERLEGALRSDVRAIRITNPQAVTSLGLVTEHHIDGILNILSYAERYILPPIVLKQTGVQLSPQVKAQAFVFTAQEKSELLAPGAATANELLPLSVQQWIVKGSNCGQFFGGLVMCMMQHAALAIALQAQEDERFPKQPAPVKPNGAAPVDVFAQPPSTTEKAGVQG